jgi:hypothetical protein
MRKDKIAGSVARLLAWLESWKTKTGAYNGYVIHRLNLKRMILIHDTPWSQAPMINSFLNLYHKTNNEWWLKKAIEAGNLQAGRLNSESKYIFAGHEDDQFCGLVHNAMANCALLDLARTLLEENSKHHARLGQKYVHIVELNTARFLIEKLWVDEKGAFKVAERDYYSLRVDRFVANMNSVAVENLIKLSILTGKKEYADHAKRVGEWLLSLQIHSESTLLDGAIPYQEPRSNTFVSIYTALSMRGLDDLYFLTKDKRYLESMLAVARNLMRFRDPKYKLFYHAFQNGSLKEYPLFVAGAGIILKAIDDVSRVCGETFSLDNTLNTILGLQLSNGGFPNFRGYNSTGNNRKNGDGSLVWEDVVPTVGWNSHLLEYLTRYVPGDFSGIARKEMKTVFESGKNYLYFETPRSAFIFGWNPFQSFGSYIVPNKTCALGFSFLDVRAAAKFIFDGASILSSYRCSRTNYQRVKK